jgi:NADPH-dependent 2,4-dienoyl-CoA reductase/sulfur reductase-like enzyme
LCNLCMAEIAQGNNFRETWDRLVLLLIAQPREGWEPEYEEIIRREIERLAIPAGEQERNE